MTLIDKINSLKNNIWKFNELIHSCRNTDAGDRLRRELSMDRDKLYHELGRLCSNSAVKICLQSEYTR